MRVYLHIGMHKTGTTSVQKNLLTHARHLDQLGYSVHVNPVQINAQHPRAFNPAWLRQQVENAEKNRLHSIVFSAEVISTFNLEQLKRLCKTFDDHDICFVACFRHWNGFLPSRWAQNCMRRDTQSFPAYFDRLGHHEIEHVDARFDLVVKRITEVDPASVRLVLFDHAINHGGIVSTVMSALGLPRQFIDSIEDRDKRYNIRKDADSTEIIRLFNGVYSLEKHYEPDELFTSISRATPVEHLYDDRNRRIFDYLGTNDDVKQQLVGLIDETRQDFLLSRLDRAILEWERKFTAVASGYLPESQASVLFEGVGDNEFACSSLEVTDLPAALRQQIIECLDHVE